MNYFTRPDIYDMFGGNEGRQIADYLVRQGYGCRRRLDDGTEYSFGALRHAVEDLASLWKYIKERSIERPVKPDKILEQLAVARVSPEAVRLFSPWGPRYRKSTAKIEDSDSEIDTLKEVRSILEEVRTKGYKPDILLMPADIYGTEINGLSEQFVRDYFSWLEEVAKNELEKVNVVPWSSIREENEPRYTELRRSVEQNFYEWVKEGEFWNAVKVARNFNPKSPERSARRYCVERVVEALIISELFDPIKLSLVRKEKDSLDGPLKRVYIVQNRAPWVVG